MRGSSNASPLLWWQASEDRVGYEAITAARSIQQLQLGLTTKNWRCAQMYEGATFMHGGRFAPNIMAGSGTITSGGVGNSNMGMSRKGPSYNLVYELVSTVKAMLLAPGSPLVTFVTNNGTFELQRRAKLLNTFVEGIFYQCGVPGEAAKVLSDSLVFGTGFLKVSANPIDNNIKVQRVWPGNVWTEMYDGRDGSPRCLYQIDLIDKDELAYMYPDKADEILKASALSTSGFTSDLYSSRQMPFYEAWRLPAAAEIAPGETGHGRHVLAIDGCVIVDEEYEDLDFPFAVLRYEDATTGYFGRGLGELLYGHQTTLSRVEFAEAHAWSQFALPRLYLNIASKMNRNHVASSRSGLMLEGMGPPGDAIQVLNWSATHPNFVAFKEWIIESAHQFCGVSTFMSSGNKPAGLDSGAAQREYADIQQNRFSVLSEKWGQLHVDLTEKIIQLGTRIWGNKSYKVKVLGKNFLKEVDWKSVKLDEDEYNLKAYPVSSLSRTPAGRLAQVQEMMQAQLITRDEGLKLLKFPDTDSILDRETAQEEYAEYLVYQMLDEGKPMPVDTAVNLPLCIDTVQKELTRALVQEAPEEKTELMRNWLVRAKAIVSPPPPPMPVGAGGPPGVGPQGPPPALAKGAAPPVNNMLPFAQPKGNA
jgi:hypothetical protein